MWNLVIIVMLSLLTGCYISLIFFFRDLLVKLTPFNERSISPATKFSVIIPARNEEKNIAHCIESIYRQRYPAALFEVIVIDDHSTDETSVIVASYQQQYPSLKLIQLKDEVKGKLLNAYKKKAIETAIGQTSGDWIITTDADCHVTNDWLLAYDNYIQLNDPALVAGPVKYINTRSFVSIFQCLDFMSLQGVTAAAVSADKLSMCNGANLAYRKDAFTAVNGFRGIDNVASGDDMLLMHKIKKHYPGRLGYLFCYDGVVSTYPMPDWKSFFNQRIRWASKAEKYDDPGIIAVLAMVYLFNVSLVVLGVMSLWSTFCFVLFILMLAVKTIAELTFMFPITDFYREKKLLWWFPLMQPFHIMYMVIAGWLGKFGSYQWKGRKVR